MSITTKSGHTLTEEQINEWAEACERGEYPGEPTGEVVMRRSLTLEEEIALGIASEPDEIQQAIDARAADLGLSRIEYLFRLIEEDLKTAKAV